MKTLAARMQELLTENLNQALLLEQIGHYKEAADALDTAVEAEARIKRHHEQASALR